MTGKIFQESNNIYEDQAKILFNYYSQAAEKIVKEEEDIESKIRDVEAQKADLSLQLSKMWWYWLICWLVIPLIIYLVKKNRLEKEIAEKDVLIAKLKKDHENIFRGYNISKLGVAYVPVADQIKYEDKSFIVDYTGNVNDSEVTLQLSRQNDLLIKTIADLENLSKEAPVVESSKEPEMVETSKYSTSIQEINQHDYFGTLDRSLRTISYCMGDLDTTSVSLPLVADKSSYLDFLHEYATTEVPQGAPVVNVFNKEKYAESINKFEELNKLKDSLSNKTQQFEDVLKGLMMTMANSVQAISALKVASTDKVVMESNKVLYQILKSPYNHYSPVLEHDEIERIRNEKFDYSQDAQDYEPFNLKPSSRVRYNLITGTWNAEDGSTTSMPFGVHQIYEEIVSPVVQNLMMETRIERLKIYNHIKDQKIDYLNKWHQDTDAFYRANRAESSDIINLMQESLREYVAAYNTLVSLKRTEDSMENSGGDLDSTVVATVDTASETLAAFEAQSQQFKAVQEDFEAFMDRLKEDIDLKAEKFGHVEYYDAKLRDGYSNEVAVAASEVQAMDERRKQLASVNPLLAKSSEMPPVPQVEDITFEHMSINLPGLAKNALDKLENVGNQSNDDLGEENIDMPPAPDSPTDGGSSGEPIDSKEEKNDVEQENATPDEENIPPLDDAIPSESKEDATVEEAENNDETVESDDDFAESDDVSDEDDSNAEDIEDEDESDDEISDDDESFDDEESDEDDSEEESELADDSSDEEDETSTSKSSFLGNLSNLKSGGLEDMIKSKLDESKAKLQENLDPKNAFKNLFK